MPLYTRNLISCSPHSSQGSIKYLSTPHTLIKNCRTLKVIVSLCLYFSQGLRDCLQHHKQCFKQHPHLCPCMVCHRMELPIIRQPLYKLISYQQVASVWLMLLKFNQQSLSSMPVFPPASNIQQHQLLLYLSNRSFGISHCYFTLRLSNY